jgi:hypothetical protein
MDSLERRAVLSAMHTPGSLIASAIVSAQTNHGGVVIDFSIPYVIAPPGVHQNAINFTSNKFHQILNGLDSAAKLFARYGSAIHLELNLEALAHQVPYGRAHLLPIWGNTVAANANGSASIGDVLHQLKFDLISYCNDNVGVHFNVLKSAGFWSSDGHLTYNGKVGHEPAHGQDIVTGTHRLI